VKNENVLKIEETSQAFFSFKFSYNIFLMLGVSFHARLHLKIILNNVRCFYVRDLLF